MTPINQILLAVVLTAMLLSGAVVSAGVVERLLPRESRPER